MMTAAVMKENLSNKCKYKWSENEREEIIAAARYARIMKMIYARRITAVWAGSNNGPPAPKNAERLKYSTLQRRWDADVLGDLNKSHY